MQAVSPSRPAATAREARRRAWLQLLRLPNLFTVPGDPLAGGILAGATSTAVWPALAAAPLLYACGLLLNDWADIDEDRRHRPERPLPAGRVAPVQVLAAAGAAGAAGVAVAFVGGPLCGATALLLLLAVVVYNLAAKRAAVSACVVMGLCRALSLLLGAAAAGTLTRPAVVAAAGLGAYVAALTFVARRETGSNAVGPRRLLPLAALLALIASLCLFAQPVPVVLLFALLPLVVAFRVAVRLRAAVEAATIQRAVGTLVRNLLPVQAMLLAGADAGLAGACILLALWPLSTLCSRRIASS